MKVLRFYMIIAILTVGFASAEVSTTSAGPALAPMQRRPPPPPDPLHIIKRHPRPPARRRPARLHIKLPHIKLPPHPKGPPPHP